MTEKTQGDLNFFRELNLLLDYSNKIYSNYLQSGKLFLYAKVLYGTNQRISQLLINNLYRCKDNEQKDAIALMFHLDVWSAIWIEEFEVQEPNLKDVFSFDNEVTFPKESVERLISSGLSRMN